MSGETRPPIDQELLRKVLESSPFFRHLKMEFVDAADGVARLSLAIQPFHINTQGIVQGGVLSFSKSSLIVKTASERGS